ncbi:hypothetical protein C8R45DRAFT_844759, partial [Mycena sanguinolenta]
FKPNFDSVFSVVIQKPLSTVFPILGTSQGLGAHILLESIASDFQEGAADSVNISGNLEDAAAPAGQGFPRQHFSYIETIKIIPGLSFLDVVVHLDGTYTWDEARKVTLYETSSDKSVVVRKIFRFEEINGGTATTVSEVLNGQCPFLEQRVPQFYPSCSFLTVLFRPIIQSKTRTVHQYVHSMLIRSLPPTS